MKQTVILTSLILSIAALAFLSFYLYQQQQTLTAEVTVEKAQTADLQATLVAMFDERRVNESEIATRTAADTQAIAALESEIANLSAAATAAANRPAPTAAPSAGGDELFGIDDPPQVRIRLRNRENVRPVNQPIDIIVSASHPLGVAVLNITLNGEPLSTNTPLDPRMDIEAITWTPTEPGEYRIEAIATTIRGRTSQPVAIDILVSDAADLESLTQQILRQIERNVEELRQLTTETEINMQIITSAELSDNVRSDLLADFTREEAAEDVLVLSMFDFIPDDYPLYDATIELLGAGIAGYYDEETNSLFVVDLDNDNALNEEEKLTHAHEYMHALQDQNFGLSPLADGQLSHDEAVAFRALGEGEASLVEFLYQNRGYLTGEQSADNNPVFVTPEASGLPTFLLSDLAFPYVRGQDFVSYFFEKGGFEAVNALWANPPTSSEHIIHPDRYEAGDQPIEVTLTDLSSDLGPNWQQLRADSFGEFYLNEYLGQQLVDATTIEEATTGWGGDRYHIYLNSESQDRLLLLEVVWDTPEDHNQFNRAFEEWSAIRFGENSQIQLSEHTHTQCWSTEDDNDIICLVKIDTQPSSLILRAFQPDQMQRLLELVLDGR